MSSFSVSFRSTDTERGVCVLDLKGELDAHTASELEAAFQRCIDEGHAPHHRPRRRAPVHLLGRARGVHGLHRGGPRAGRRHQDRALQPRVYNVFDLLGFPVLFDITPTEAEAVARFGSDEPPGGAPGGPAPGDPAPGAQTGTT
jgi:anti-sigma B factor antagonist